MPNVQKYLTTKKKKKKGCVWNPWDSPVRKLSKNKRRVVKKKKKPNGKRQDRFQRCLFFEALDKNKIFE